MFQNLKEKLQAEVGKTNQTSILGTFLPHSASITKDSDTRTLSITSRDDNLENNRSRLDSASSDISQFSIGQNPNTSITYVSPPRHYMPPSDLESEYGGDESDQEINTIMIKLQKLLSIQKNKFNRLKNAYSEVKRENEHIKKILQQHQDSVIKRLLELRNQIQLDRQAKEELEALHQEELRKRDKRIEEFEALHQEELRKRNKRIEELEALHQEELRKRDKRIEELEALHQEELRKRNKRIEELTLQVNTQKDLIQLPTQADREEIEYLREKLEELT